MCLSQLKSMNSLNTPIWDGSRKHRGKRCKTEANHNNNCKTCFFGRHFLLNSHLDLFRVIQYKFPSFRKLTTLNIQILLQGLLGRLLLLRVARYAYISPPLMSFREGLQPHICQHLFIIIIITIITATGSSFGLPHSLAVPIS